MSHPTARPWSGPAGVRATAAAAATVAAAVFTVPAAHADLPAVEDHPVPVPHSSVSSDNSPVVHNILPVALTVPMPRVSPEDVADLSGIPGAAGAVAGLSGIPGAAGAGAGAVGTVSGADARTQAGGSKLMSGVIRQAGASESIRSILAGTAPGTGQPHKLAEMITAPVAAVTPAATPAAAPEVVAGAAAGASRPGPTGLVMPPAPSKGGAALKAAMGAMGTPYHWGGTGRGGFDCSGLAQWAYRKAGVSLPRSSRAQSGVGTLVSRADLRPGDLVFFYRPVSHVGIYVGNGNVVHAPESGDVVKVSPISRMPFAGARRLAG
ncbi:MAG TPA: NlpC/P60 family protein [Pseudonocardia sp.]